MSEEEALASAYGSACVAGFVYSERGKSTKGTVNNKQLHPVASYYRYVVEQFYDYTDQAIHHQY